MSNSGTESWNTRGSEQRAEASAERAPVEVAQFAPGTAVEAEGPSRSDEGDLREISLRPDRAAALEQPLSREASSVGSGVPARDPRRTVRCPRCDGGGCAFCRGVGGWTPEEFASTAEIIEADFALRAPCPRCKGEARVDEQPCSLCEGLGVAPRVDERDGVEASLERDRPIALLPTGKQPPSPRPGSAVDLVEQLRELVRSSDLEDLLSQARARSLAHRFLVALDERSVAALEEVRS